MADLLLKGARLHLRPVTPADIDGPYLSWLNDPETTRFLDTGREPVTREALERMVRASVASTDAVLLAIVDRQTGRHIGNIRLSMINRLHRTASLGILIGEREFRGKGYAREAVELMLRHAFERLGLHKVTAGAYSDHAACLTAFQRAGFAVEGRQRQHLFRDGIYHDKVLMGCLREEFLARASSAERAAVLADA